jgi:glutamine cyclotransferase
MKKWILATSLIALIVSGGLIAYVALNYKTPSNATIDYTYEVVNAYPHDTNAFTEGLVYDSGFLYESTGINGYSTLRKEDLKTGQTLQLYSLPPQFFGEGITIFGDRIIQLTWQSQKGFVYDKDSFDILEEFSYRGEGWGITHDDNRLIMSNGSATLSFLDPVTFKIIGDVQVNDGNTPVTNLNELEYIHGDVYANVWHQDKIAIINIQTGQVKGWINLTGLYDTSNTDPENVLNGIAYDANSERLFVTGKRWPQLFEINLKTAG